MHRHLCYRGWWFYQGTLIHFQTFRGHVRNGSDVPLVVGLCLTWSHICYVYVYFQVIPGTGKPNPDPYPLHFISNKDMSQGYYEPSTSNRIHHFPNYLLSPYSDLQSYSKLTKIISIPDLTNIKPIIHPDKRILSPKFSNLIQPKSCVTH